MIFQNKSHAWGWMLFIAAVYVAAWMMQDTLFLNYDVSWLMHAARRMLAGGSYVRDFFETNPPLILYLYLPPVLLSKLLAIHITLLFRGYIFLLASVSLGFCAVLARKIFTHEHRLLAAVFLLILTSVLLVLPCHDFGQRDHLLVIFTMPYFLLVACRLQNKPIHRYLALVVGVMAGLGFAIKPQFLLTPLLIEAYYAVNKKNTQAWLRLETLALLLTVVLYTVSIFIEHPDYVYIVVPYSLRLYYSAVSQSWSALLLNRVALYCAFPLLFYRFLRPDQSYRYFSDILLLGLLGFLLAYVAQRMTHYYHLIPPLSLALLLLVLLLASTVSGWSKRWAEGVFAAIVALLFFMFPVWIVYNLYLDSLSYKKVMLNKLVTFMDQYARDQAVYFFVTAGDYAFPAVDYTAARMAPRFYFLWMAAGLANQAIAQDKILDLNAAAQQDSDKNFMINMIADDLYTYQPRFVFIDLSKEKYRFKGNHFDYLAYFSVNQKFKQEWMHYHYFTTLEQPGRFKLGVYQRATS